MRQHSGAVAVDARSRGDGPCCGCVVAGEHPDLRAGCAQCGDGLSRRRFDPVGDACDGQRPILRGEPDEGFGFVRQAGRLALQLRRNGDPVAVDEPAVAGIIGTAPYAARDARSGEALERFDLRREAVAARPGFRCRLRGSALSGRCADAPMQERIRFARSGFPVRPGHCPCGSVLHGPESGAGCGGGRRTVEIPHDRLGQRMFRTPFERGENRGALPGCVVGPRQIAHGRTAFGQRARLVEHDRIDPACGFEALGVSDEDAVPGSLADPHHDGGRRGQPQCAGAGDDEHRNECQKAVRQTLRAAEEHPRPEREQGHGDDRGHENAGDPVDELLHGGLAALRLLHHADDLREHRVAPDFLGPEAECAPLVDGAGEDGGARLFGHGKRLAAEHALVHVGRTVDDGAVHGDALARADGDQVVGTDCLDGHGPLAAGRAERNRAGPEAHQFADGRRGVALGPLLQQTPHEDEGHDDGRSLEIDVGFDAAREPERGEKQVEETEQPRHARAERDERVHRGRSVPQLARGIDEEASAQPEDDRRRKQAHHEAGMGRVHEKHPHDRHGQCERRGPHRAAAERGEAARVLPLGGVGVLRLVADQQIVAGAADRLAQRFGRRERRVVGHDDFARREVDRGFRDARGPAEGFVDPCGARSAAHPRDGKGFPDDTFFRHHAKSFFYGTKISPEPPAALTEFRKCFTEFPPDGAPGGPAAKAVPGTGSDSRGCGGGGSAVRKSGALRGIARKGRAHEAAFVCGREPPEAAGAAHAGGRGGCERRTPRPGGAGCRQDAEGRQVRISGCIRLPCGRVQARADARNRGLRTRRERARTAAEARRRTAARSARSRGARTIAACGPCIRVRRTAWADRGPRIRCSLAAADGDAARCGADDVTIRNFELQFSDEASYFYKIFHTFANKST